MANISRRKSVSKISAVTATVFAILFAACALSPANYFGAARAFRTIGSSLPEETGSVHQPLATVGVTLGQTARINVVNSPDPNRTDPPTPITVEMCFHDSNGDLILDRARSPVQKTVTIDPHHGESLDLNGSLVAIPGARVVIVPCVRILRISRGSLAVPTVEIFSNLLKTTFALSPGIARGFDPQPDPPVPPEVAFGLVGITQGVTARLYVVNAQNPNGAERHEPITVELTLHDATDNVFIDRAGRPTQRTLTLNPNQADFLELNGSDIAAAGARVGIVPCLKVLSGSPGSLVVPTFEMYMNVNQQTLLLSNFSDPLTVTVHDELIMNGGFEESGWTLSGTALQASTDGGTGSFPHSGTGYLVLGNANSTSGQAYQQITIPSDATS